MRHTSPPSLRYALILEYDGSDYAGWQSQDPVATPQPTVQRCLEQALSRVADHPVAVICAGRTDAGVHATAQIVHFDSAAPRPLRAWVWGVNTHLPQSIVVLAAQHVPPDFHARFSAQRRRYRYVILSRPIRPSLAAQRVAWDYRPLDEQRMAAAAVHLLGEHDFSAYRAVACQAKNPVRTLYRLEIVRRGDLITLDIEANGFLHHMVRNIAGVLMAIGAGEREPDWARTVLEGRDRRLGGVTAPPGGLYLTGVSYPSHYGLPVLCDPAPLW